VNGENNFRLTPFKRAIARACPYIIWGLVFTFHNFEYNIDEMSEDTNPNSPFYPYPLCLFLVIGVNINNNHLQFIYKSTLMNTLLFFEQSLNNPLRRVLWKILSPKIS